MSRDPAVFDPVEESILMRGKDVLVGSDAQMLGRASAYPHDLFLKLASLTVVFFVGDLLCAEVHGLGKGRDKLTRECLYFLLGKVLFQLL